MKALPDEVFVGPQIMPSQVYTLAEQGVVSLINNRPDMEGPMQPPSADIAEQADAHGMGYAYIPMAGGLAPDLIEATLKAYETMPRPIYTFCLSGMRSTALWCFAHVEKYGVDGVLDAAAEAGYSLGQLRGGLSQFLESRSNS